MILESECRRRKIKRFAGTDCTGGENRKKKRREMSWEKKRYPLFYVRIFCGFFSSFVCFFSLTAIRIQLCVTEQKKEYERKENGGEKKARKKGSLFLLFDVWCLLFAVHFFFFCLFAYFSILRFLGFIWLIFWWFFVDDFFFACLLRSFFFCFFFSFFFRISNLIIEQPCYWFGSVRWEVTKKKEWEVGKRRQKKNEKSRSSRSERTREKPTTIKCFHLNQQKDEVPSFPLWPKHNTGFSSFGWIFFFSSLLHFSSPFCFLVYFFSSSCKHSALHEIRFSSFLFFLSLHFFRAWLSPFMLPVFCSRLFFFFFPFSSLIVLSASSVPCAQDVTIRADALREMHRLHRRGDVAVQQLPQERRGVELVHRVEQIEIRRSNGSWRWNVERT